MSPLRATEKLETATQTLEKEAEFLKVLIETDQSAKLANRIVMLTSLFKFAAFDVPLYLSDQGTNLFLYKPEKTWAILAIFVNEIARNARLSAYLCVKGIFPQAISVLRTAVELIGVYTHIWNEPEKVDCIEDSDSRTYSEAFRYSTNKKLQKQLKSRKVKYRFQHCQEAKLISQLYEILSGQFIHATSLKQLVCPILK